MAEELSNDLKKYSSLVQSAIDRLIDEILETYSI